MERMDEESREKKGRYVGQLARRVGVMARYGEYLCQCQKGCGLMLGNEGDGTQLDSCLTQPTPGGDYPGVKFGLWWEG